MPGYHLKLLDRARMRQAVSAARMNKRTRKICVEIAGYAQRRLYQRVPHKNFVIEPRAGDVVLLEDILQPVHTLCSSLRAHHILKRRPSTFFVSPQCCLHLIKSPRVTGSDMSCMQELTLPFTLHSPGDVSTYSVDKYTKQID